MGKMNDCGFKFDNDCVVGSIEKALCNAACTWQVN